MNYSSPLPLSRDGACFILNFDGLFKGVSVLERAATIYLKASPEMK